MDSAPPATTTRARARADALIGQRDGLKAGGAEAVDGGAGDFDGKARAQSSHTGDVPALLALGLRAAEDYVVNGRFVEGGNPSRAPLRAVAARSSGRMVESAPLGARPTGVRTAATRTASGMVAPDAVSKSASQQPSDDQRTARSFGLDRSSWTAEAMLILGVDEGPGVLGIKVVDRCGRR